MCGRYVLYSDEKIYSRFNVSNRLDKLEKNYNVSPGQLTPVITQNKGKNLVSLMRWGLVPHWAKDDSIGYKMINARAETISQKPSFKAAFEKRRCLVPANGFYEWKKEGSRKIPYYFYPSNESMFSFAGIFENWTDNNGKTLNTFSIVTTESSDWIADYHERMPLILSPDLEQKWVSAADNKLPASTSYILKNISVYPVSDMVNNSQNNTPDLILPLK